MVEIIAGNVFETALSVDAFSAENAPSKSGMYSRPVARIAQIWLLGAADRPRTHWRLVSTSDS